MKEKDGAKMIYILSDLDYMGRTFYNAITATPETRRAMLARWEKIDAENKNKKRYDLIIFSAENIRAIKAAGTIAEYTEKCNTIFNWDGEIISFEFPDGDAEYFETYNAAAAFAAYNLNEMEKAGVNNEII